MISHDILANGLALVTEYRPGSGKVSMQVHIRRGANVDAAAECGLSNLMQESCFSGTTSRSLDQIAEDIEGKGGAYSGHTGLTETSFHAVALARYADETFDVLADVILNPAFDTQEVDKIKTKTYQWLKQQQQKPSTQAALKFTENVFNGQSAALNIMGTAETLKNLTQEQLRRNHADLLVNPSDIVISFAGDITPDAVRALVEKHFGRLPAKKTTAAPIMHFAGGDFRDNTSHEQMNLKFGFPAPSQESDDRYAMILFRELLDGGMSSPLFQEIREKRGLVYSVGASYSPYPHMGVFSISAGTGKGNAGELMSTTFTLLGDIARTGFEQQDIDRAIARIMLSRKGSIETVDNAASRNAAQLLTHGRLISTTEYETRLRSVTPDDIRRVCLDMLNSNRYALAGVGPQDSMPAPHDIQGMMKSAIDGIQTPAKNPAKTIDTSHTAQGGSKNNTAPARMTILENGIKVITVTRDSTLACGAWLGVGAAHEPININGAAHMNEHMMFKGTPSYGPGEIDMIVEGELGGALNAYTSHDKTCYYFYNLEQSALPKIVDICGEMIYQANIDHEEFDGRTVIMPDGTVSKAKGERDVVLEEIKRANDNLSNRQWYLMNETAYPNQPQGRTVLGPYDTIKNMTAQELRDFRDAYYGAGNTIFCAVGPVEHDDFVDLIRQKYGHMPKTTAPALPTPSYVGGTAVLQNEKATICSVGLAAEAVSTGHSDQIAYNALSMILGDGASSRFEKEIVNKLELAPGVGATVVDYRNCGFFYVGSYAEPENVRPLVREIYSGIRSVAEHLDQAELDKIKAAMEMAVLSDFEKNQDACNEYACLLQAHDRLYTPADLAESIRQLTVDDVQRVAREVLRSNPTATYIIPEGVDRAMLPTHEETVSFRDGRAANEQTPPTHRPRFG